MPDLPGAHTAKGGNHARPGLYQGITSKIRYEAMFTFTLLFGFLLIPNAWAEGGRCDMLKAESIELSAATPAACDEARDTHSAYVKAFPEVLEICRKLEAEVAAGEPKLALGTEDEMQLQIMEAKQRHLSARRESAEHITRDLLSTPLDIGDLSRIPPQVSSECGSAIEAHVRFRRQVLQVLNDFFAKLDSFDNALFRQSAERALPAPLVPPSPASGHTMR